VSRRPESSRNSSASGQAQPRNGEISLPDWPSGGRGGRAA
jgi:hypothetical protein